MNFVSPGYHAIGKGHDKPDEEEELIEEEVKVRNDITFMKYYYDNT